MTADPSRSEQVISDYKKHKLARSALRHIHALIRGYEEEREVDRKLARIGIVVLVLLIAAGVYFALSAERVVIG